MSRRDALIIGVGALGAAAGGLDTSALAQPATSADWVESHGMSAFGDLKYPADFKHFDYVNRTRLGGSFSYLGGGASSTELSPLIRSTSVRGDGAPA
jgi:microcin C transport system substrate-binding protein